MADTEDLLKDVGEGIKYLKKKKEGRSPFEEQLERSIGEEPTLPPPPSPKKKMTDKSTEGSPPFSDAELKQGYRKVK